MRKLPMLLIPLLALPLVGAGPCGSESSTTAAPATAGASSSTPAGVTVPGTVLLAPGESAAIEGRGVAVRFASILEDSRCPRGVECVWAGRARVAVELVRDGGVVRTVELEVGSQPVEAEGLRLAAEALDPYPSAEAPTRTEQYRLRLRVEAAGG